MSRTYPAAPVAVKSDATTLEVHAFMKSPTAIRRRLQELLDHKFIADSLLTGRFAAVGGAILYETGEQIFLADDLERVAPGGSYPRSVMTSGEIAAAKTEKWGRDVEVTDEAISRLLMNPVERALQKLANTTVRQVDSMALATIASKVTATAPASATWTSGDAIVNDVLLGVATHGESTVGEAYEVDTVVLKPTQWAKAMAALSKAGLLPREENNPLNTGEFPNVLGLNWLTSTHVPFTDPFFLDTTRLGGMADENLGSPGYSTANGNVEVKSGRVSDSEGHDRDGYYVRARRVTVPVVLEAAAGFRITGTGLV